jgi:hypothetical protein
VVAFLELLADSWRRRRPVEALVVVPLVNAFLQYGNVERVLAFDGVRFGVQFPFPAPLLTAWSFASVPQVGDGLRIVGPAWLFPVAVALEAVLVAGYLGSLDEGFHTGSYDFAANVVSYVVPLFAYTVLANAVVLGVGLLGLRVGVLALAVAIPTLLTLGYLFWATPFLVVVEDRGFLTALQRSATLAAGGGEYAEFFLKHLLVGAVVSVAVTPVMVNAGVAGVVIGAVVGAPIAFTFTLATLRFLRRYLGAGASGDGEGTSGESGEQSGDDAPATSAAGVDGGRGAAGSE